MAEERWKRMEQSAPQDLKAGYRLKAELCGAIADSLVLAGIPDERFAEQLKRLSPRSAALALGGVTANSPLAHLWIWHL
jgi:hypothetical protein